MSAPSTNPGQDVVLTERPHEHVALVRLNRPKALNAISNELFEQLIVALETLAAEGVVRAAVITGDARAFAAGADIAEFAAGPQLEMWDRLFAVNVRAPFFLVQQLLPILGKGSSVIFTSSLAARSSVGTLAAYAATKGAIDTLVKHFAYVLGARGIRVNAVAPGVVETDMSNFTKTENGRNFALGMQALKRIAQPDDIGDVVAFLASEEARWITGDIIHVDGGSKL